MSHTVTKTILKKTKQQAIVKLVGSGDVSITANDIVFYDQTVDLPNVFFPITAIIYNVKGDTSIGRNGNTVIELNSMTDGEMNLSQTYGISLQEGAHANVDVSLQPGFNTLILVFSKENGFIDINRQTLQIKDR